MVDRQSVSVSLPARMVADLRAEAQRRDVSFSQVVRERIKQGKSQNGAEG